MPRNSQGVYTLPAGNPVVPGTLIETTWANPTMADIADALTGSLPRDGTAPMTGPLTLPAGNPTGALHATNKAYVDSFMAYASGLAIGAVVAYGGATVPPGFLLCDGSAVSRTTYADLFATIGTTFGAGDNSTTFNVPDLRDQFIRGRSASRQIGSTQAGSFASHTHGVSDPGHTHTAFQAAHDHTITTGGHNHGVNDPGHFHQATFYAHNDNGPLLGNANGGASGTMTTDTRATGISLTAAGNLGGSADARQPAVTVASAVTGLSLGTTGGTETVPQNMALDYIIKAVNDSTGPAVITGIGTSDANMIAIDNTNPVSPMLDIQSNLPFGIPKLDAAGKIMLSQLPSSSQQLLGYFDASSGLNPSQAYPSEVFVSGDTYVISVAGTISVYDPVTLLSAMTPVSAGSLLQYVTGSLTNPTGWYYVVATSTVVASQVGLTPVGNISATNVQAGFAEVDGDLTTQAAAIAALQTSVAGKVSQSSATGAAHMPAGTTAERDTSTLGAFRYNSELNVFEGLDNVGWNTLSGISQAFADANYLQVDGGNQLAAPLVFDASAHAVIRAGSQAVANLPSTCGIAFCKNKLLNGEVTRINQRGFDGNWAAKGNYPVGGTIAQKEATYGYDQWAKASATDMLQVIEAGNFRPSTVHTLSGQNVTTQQITSPASGNWTITVPQTASNVQLEEGAEATPFEIRPIAFELAQCQRYYEQVVVSWCGQVVATGIYYAGSNYSVQKRADPDISSVGQSGLGNGGFNTRSGTGSNKTITWSGSATGNINGAGFQDTVAVSAVL